GMLPMLCAPPERRCLARTVRDDKLHVGQKVGQVYIKVVRHAQGAVKLVDAWRGGSSSKDHFSPCGTSSCRVLRTKTRETEKGTGNEGAGWPRDRGDSRLAEDVPKEDVLRPRPAIAGHPSTSKHDSIEYATSPRPLQSDSSLRDPVDRNGRRGGGRARSSQIGRVGRQRERRTEEGKGNGERREGRWLAGEGIEGCTTEKEGGRKERGIGRGIEREGDREKRIDARREGEEERERETEEQEEEEEEEEEEKEEKEEEEGEEGGGEGGGGGRKDWWSPSRRPPSTDRSPPFPRPSDPAARFYPPHGNPRTEDKNQYERVAISL
ncbi:hypothetical protein ALC60_00207, partial [Trachymyrmex zeteki]